MGQVRDRAAEAPRLAAFGCRSIARMALDGSIGKIDRATYDTNTSYVVVDTGPWIFGRKVVLPAGVIDGIDRDDGEVFVHRTKDEIKDSPEYDDTRFDEAYRNELGTYYGAGGRGYRQRALR